jgi:hypothetical protein
MGPELEKQTMNNIQYHFFTNVVLEILPNGSLDNIRKQLREAF